MRIVITGAAGFIGSVLTVRAAEQGHTVLAVDDLSRGLNHPEVFDPQVSHHKLKGGVIVGQRHDCRSGFAEVVRSDRMRDAHGVRRGDVDAVVHLAAGTGSLDRPLDELRGLNVEMTKRVWQDAVDLGAKVFAFPTTSLGTIPELAAAPYVRSKEEAMAWLLDQRGVYREGPTIVPLRFFNVAGAYKGRSEKRQKEVHLIPRLAECYKTGDPLVINGDDYPETQDGTPSRDFIHVLDVADGILALLDRAREHAPYHDPFAFTHRGGEIWLGTGYVTSALQALRIFEQWAGPIGYKIGPRRAYDCGTLRCPVESELSLRSLLGRPLAPAWVSIRDEAQELLR